MEMQRHLNLRSRVWARFVVAALIGAGLAPTPVRAEQPSVTAVLTSSETAVGQPVQLQISISGARSAEIPDFSVEGLDIRASGTSQHFEMNNFDVSASIVYAYTIMPTKAGTYKIPPQTVRIAGATLRTPELSLRVTESAGGSARSGRSGPQSNDSVHGKIGFAELVIPKQAAYVGEAVPLQLRIGVNARVQVTQYGAPREISGQGFTSPPLQKSGETVETINGRAYNVLIYKSAISAARSGKLEVPPVEAQVVALLPESRDQQSPSTRRRSPFDPWDMDDFFNDPFSMFGGTVRPRKITIKSEPATVDVKPLPPNAPQSFSGAVGNFTMVVDANPKNVNTGDPITVTATVTGRGNFDRMNAPALEEETGWHKYPPSSKFKQDDDVGISGAKTFEMVVSPNEKKQAIPPFVFSYFDPVKENYVTLRSDAIPIVVAGSAVAAPTAAPTVSATAAPVPGSTTPATTAASPPPSKPADILYQLSDRPIRAQSFAPLYARRNFWLIQLVPLLALIGFVGWKIRRARIDNLEAQRIAGLQSEASELMRKLRRNDSNPQEFFSEASRAIRIKTALAKNVDPNVIDAEVAANTFQLDQTSRERLQRLFERADELRYSGGQNGAGAISQQDRHDVLELVESLKG